MAHASTDRVKPLLRVLNCSWQRRIFPYRGMISALYVLYTVPSCDLYFSHEVIPQVLEADCFRSCQIVYVIAIRSFTCTDSRKPEYDYGGTGRG